MSSFHDSPRRIIIPRMNRKLSKGLSSALVLLLGAVSWTCQTSYLATSPSDSLVNPVIESVPLQDSSSSIPLAVYPLKNFGAPASATWAGSTLTELLISDLSHRSHLTIVSRGNVGSVLREQWIQKLYSDSEELVRVGRLQGARLIVKGGFIESDGNIMVDLQIIDVETGVVWDTVRGKGQLVELPLLSQSLVNLLLERLPKENSVLGDTLNGSGITFEKSEADLPSRELPSQMVFQEDMSQIGESRFPGHIRNARTAKKIFEQGFMVELGRPDHRVKSIQKNSGQDMYFILVPFAIYAEENRIRDVIGREISHEMALRIFDAERLSSKYSDDHLTEQRNFVRQVARPRRLFVRARSEQDEIIAIFSRLEWRTDRVMSFTNGLHMKMPFWPKPFFTGLAEFPGNWLERGEMAVTFDTVFLDIHQEEASVAVEWIDFQQQVPEKPIEILETLTRHLQKWIQDRWAPPIAETLPFKGYLPRNKQRAHIRLHVEHGVITHIDHQYSFSDPLFENSLEELTTQVLYSCPWCKSNQDLPDVLHLADFRVQCTLVKPTHQAGLGSRLP